MIPADVVPWIPVVFAVALRAPDPLLQVVALLGCAYWLVLWAWQAGRRPA